MVSGFFCIGYTRRKQASRLCIHKFPQPVFTLWWMYLQEANIGIDKLIRRPSEYIANGAQSLLMSVSEKTNLHIHFFIASKANEVKMWRSDTRRAEVELHGQKEKKGP